MGVFAINHRDQTSGIKRRVRRLVEIVEVYPSDNRYGARVEMSELLISPRNSRDDLEIELTPDSEMLLSPLSPNNSAVAW